MLFNRMEILVSLSHKKTRDHFQDQFTKDGYIHLAHTAEFISSSLVMIKQAAMFWVAL